MKALISIIKIRFNLLLQYRTAALAGIFTQLFFGFILVMVLLGFYGSTTDTIPMTMKIAVSYTWMGQAMLGLLPWNGDKEIQRLIRDGNVSYELIRPMNLYNYWFARAFALRTAPTLLKSIPLFIITIFFLPKEYSLMLPSSIFAFLAWIVCLFGSLLISCGITNLVNITTLYSLSGDGIQRLLTSLVTLCSGMVIPLPLFPENLKKILNILPFSGLLDIPTRFYTGDIHYSNLLKYFMFQISWAIVIYFLGKFILTKKMKSLVVQGG